MGRREQRTWRDQRQAAFMSPNSVRHGSGRTLGTSSLSALCCTWLGTGRRPSTPPPISRPSARCAVPVRPARPSRARHLARVCPHHPARHAGRPGEPLPKRRGDAGRHRDRARSAFKPAGQTSSSAGWRHLQRLDGAPTISKAASQTPALDDPSTAARRSEDLVFDDSPALAPEEGPVRPRNPPWPPYRRFSPRARHHAGPHATCEAAVENLATIGHRVLCGRYGCVAGVARTTRTSATLPLATHSSPAPRPAVPPQRANSAAACFNASAASPGGADACPQRPGGLASDAHHHCHPRQKTMKRLCSA